MTSMNLVISSISNSNCKSKTTIVEDIYFHHIQVSGLHAPSSVWEIITNAELIYSRKTSEKKYI